MDIEKKEICFNYKGGRGYVHGTDMINSVLAYFQSTGIENIFGVTILPFWRSPKLITGLPK